MRLSQHGASLEISVLLTSRSVFDGFDHRMMLGMLLREAPLVHNGGAHA